MRKNTRRARRRNRTSAIAQGVLPLQQAPHATIDVSLAARADVPRVGENPIMCAACGETRPCAGAAIVNIVPLSAEAKRGMGEPREEMLPLCAECLASPTVSTALVRSY